MAGYALSAPYAVALAGNRQAIAAISSGAVTLVDVSNPANPVLLTTAKDGVTGADLLGEAIGVAFAGTNLAVAGYFEHAYTILEMGTQQAGLASAGWVRIPPPSASSRLASAPPTRPSPDRPCAGSGDRLVPTAAAAFPPR